MRDFTLIDVVIVGGGPNGLMLACELALAGVRPLVLEQRPVGEITHLRATEGEEASLDNLRASLARVLGHRVAAPR
jgi:2-polyprenyl-6-methoxyphenol hydroxylase-like FAD-dependent oxidoreductase